MAGASRGHDVSGLTAGELERARRELEVSLALTRPGSPALVPILAHLSAIEAELAGRATGTAVAQPHSSPVIYLCSCGFGTDDPNWLQGHLFRHPGHHERPRPY